MHSAHIDVWHLAKRMLLWLILPCAAGIALDLATGLWPVVTLITVVVVVPLAGVFVSRAAVSEMDRVMREVAPKPESTVIEGEEEEAAADSIMEGV